MGADKIRTSTPIYTIKDLEKTVLLKDLGEALEVQSQAWNEAITE